jgi:excisionase family DNA binding protein
VNPAPRLDVWFCTDEVAAHFGVTRRAVLRMIRLGRLRAYKKGWEWLVYRDDLPSEWPPPVS